MAVKVSQVARLLGISYKTIERAIERGDLKNHQNPAPYDEERRHKPGPRYYLVDLTEARAYFEARGTITRLAATEDGELIQDLLDEIAGLRKQLEEKQAQSTSSILSYLPPKASPLTSGVSYETPHVRTHPLALPRSSRSGGRRERVTETPDLPSHMFALALFCEAHGINANTARGHWRDQGIFTVKGPYKLGRIVSHWGIDQENALKALKHWRKMGLLPDEQLGNCALPNCPCAALLPRNQLLSAALPASAGEEQE